MSATPNPRLESLLDGCRRGDRSAQYEIYKLYSKAMYNTAWRILNEEAAAEDVLQDAFLEAFTGLQQFRGESTFGAWLKRIVVNKSINALKRRKWTPVENEELDLLAGGEDPPPFPDEVPLSMSEILSAVEQLPEGYRIVFSMYLIEGYDHEEIANFLGISVSGSKSQLNRAKLKLQKILIDRNYVRQI